MDTFGSGTSSRFERVDFFLFVYLLFLNLNNNLTLPQTFDVAEAEFDLKQLMCVEISTHVH